MKKTIALILIYIFTSCSSFDSNKLNKELIQGKWKQVALVEFVDGKASTERIRDNTFLTFRADSCIEEMKTLGEIHLYRYNIKDYFLSLKDEENIENYMIINKLTKDSLLLKADDRILKYIR